MSFELIFSGVLCLLLIGALLALMTAVAKLQMAKEDLKEVEERARKLGLELYRVNLARALFDK